MWRKGERELGGREAGNVWRKRVRKLRGRKEPIGRNDPK
jgi:hypothetical protein